MNDDKRNEELRRRKIENFRVQIPEDSFPQESGRSPREEPPAINSYSRPEKNHRAADVRMAERKAARRAAKAANVAGNGMYPSAAIAAATENIFASAIPH